MILFIDNYDSFTYNLVQYLGSLQPNLEVVRNDRITLKEIEEKIPPISFCHRDRDIPKTQVSVKRLSGIFRGRFPFWEFVWGIRPFVRYTAERLLLLPI